MRLIIKKGAQNFKELQFSKGPVYIGRQPNSQVFLPSEAISRQHAVIFATQDGKWILEDLDSANKTYLNDQAVHKNEIKHGDTLKIVDFTIEVKLQEDKKPKKPSELEDTLTTTARGPQIIIRKPDAEQAPPIRFPAKRAIQFLQATDAISKAKNLEEVIQVFLGTVAEQLGTYHIWAAVRNQPTGPMTCHAGKNRDGQPVQLNELEINEKINEALEKNEFLLFLFSRDMAVEKKVQIRSVIIAPFISKPGCFGILYADNTFRDDHYSLSDLDYAMLLGMHTAAILGKL